MTTTARIAITKMGMSSNPKDCTIIIDIEDESSGLIITRLEMTPEMYGMVIAGTGDVICDMVVAPDHKTVDCIGKEVEVKAIFLEGFKKSILDDGQSMNALVAEVRPYITQGWEVNSYGLTTRQTDPRGHKVTLKRYV